MLCLRCLSPLEFDLVLGFHPGPPLWVVTWIVDPLLNPPGIWFALNTVWMCIVCYSLTRLMRNLEQKALGALTLRVKLNKKIKSEDGLMAYLSLKIIESTDSITDAKQSMKRVLWEEHDKEKWLGSNPVIELAYDDRFWFIIAVTITIDCKTSNATEEDLINIFLQVCHCVFLRHVSNSVSYIACHSFHITAVI